MSRTPPSFESTKPIMPRSQSMELEAALSSGVTYIIRGDKIGGGAQGSIFRALMLTENLNFLGVMLKLMCNSGSGESAFHRKITQGMQGSSSETGLLRSIGIWSEQEADPNCSLPTENGSRQEISTSYLVLPECAVILSDCLPRIQQLKDDTEKSALYAQLMLQFLDSMARALHTLHEIQVEQGDIKPQNAGLRDGRLCFFDFGSAKEATRNDRFELDFTLSYVSFDKVAASGAACPYASDMYSMGMILLELLNEKTPNQHVLDEMTNAGAKAITSLSAILQFGLLYNTARENRDKAVPVKKQAKEQQNEILSDIQKHTDFMECLMAIARHMSALLPEDRLTVATLKNAIAHLTQLAPICDGDAVKRFIIKDLIVATAKQRNLSSQPKQQGVQPATGAPASNSGLAASGLAGDSLVRVRNPIGAEVATTTESPELRAGTPEPAKLAIPTESTIIDEGSQIASAIPSTVTSRKTSPNEAGPAGFFGAPPKAIYADPFSCPPKLQ